MISIDCQPYTLRFRERAITSRDSLTEKNIYILTIQSEELPGGCATGEVAMFSGLSAEDTPEFHSMLVAACEKGARAASIAEMMEGLPEISSIRFGFESALIRSRKPVNTNEQQWLDGERAITINGLIWMGDKATMRRRIAEKIEAGFRCVKLKIGGINFVDEVDLLRMIRSEFSPSEIELRLDANGSFTTFNAIERLKRLSDFTIHSIEQPIRQGQWQEMASLCAQSPIPIALDEELIGFHSDDFKRKLLTTIRPCYIILKPTLCGGFGEAGKWIHTAQELGIGWWGTSALESNIGLEAIARWTASLNPTMPQGLGTGALYTNNFPSSLQLRGDKLYCYESRE